MERNEKTLDNLTLEEWHELTDIEQLLCYLRRQTVWVNGIGQNLLCMHIAQMPFVDCVVIAFEQALRNGDAQAHNLIEKWKEALAAANNYTLLSDRLEELSFESQYGEHWREARELPGQPQGENYALDDFWDLDDEENIQVLPGVVLTDWQRAILQRIIDAKTAEKAEVKRIKPTYKAFKDVVEIWFCQTQPEAARKQYEVEERTNREKRLLLSVLVPQRYDDELTDEDKEMEALKESLVFVSVSDCIQWLYHAVDLAEQEGTCNKSLNLPSDLFMAAANKPRLYLDSWETVKDSFWEAFDASDISTVDACLTWRLASDVTDQAVHALRQESLRLQSQGFAGTIADEKACELSEIRQLVKAALLLSNRFLLQIWGWYEAYRPEEARKMHQDTAQRDIKNRPVSLSPQYKARKAGDSRSKGKKKFVVAPVKAAEYPIHTSQEIDALLRSAADGRSGRYWQTDHHSVARIYRVPNIGHVVRMRLTDVEIAEGLDVEALERLTCGQDADCAFAILYVLRLLAPLVPLPDNTAPVGWIDLDDIANKIGWIPRSTAEREQMRARIWDYLNYAARAIVSGKRTGVYRDRHTGEPIATEIDGPILAFHEREVPMLAVPSKVPLRVEISLSRTWARLITDPQTVQYLPLGELLGSIPRGQPSGAWARCIGIALANLWRREPEKTLNDSLRPTRRDLLQHYTPSKAAPQEVLDGHDPARARAYWRQALRILVDLGFLALEGEASNKASIAKRVQHKNWQHLWLKEHVALRPGPKMLPAVQAAAQARTKRGARGVHRAIR